MSDFYNSEQIRKENYELCHAGKAPPPTQRIYDAFVRQYPDALITGISIKDDGKRLLLYLDGKPAYYASFDPLINGVGLEKCSSDAESSPSSSASQQKEADGCLTIFLKAVMIVLLAMPILSIILAFVDNDDPAPVRPTAKPTATAAQDDIISWATYYARINMPKDMSLDIVETSVSVGETYLTIACNMDTMWDSDDYIRSAAQLIIDVIPLIRDRHGYDNVTFLFYGPFTDKYGNSTQSLGMRAMYSRHELQTINCDYFGDYIYSKPDAIFKVNKNYLIHPSYYD